MNYSSLAFAVITALRVLHPLSAAAAGTPAPVVAARTHTPPTLDGRLDEPAWQTAPLAPLLVQRQPTEGAPATMTTEVRVLFDDRNLYVAARLLDSEPAAIVARLGRRDASTGADLFRLFLDTFHDHRTAAYFSVDAAGTQGDGIIANDTMNTGDWDNSWNPVWSAAVGRGGDGWIVELAIPFSQLRYQANGSPVWGINVQRDVSRNHESDYLAFTPRVGAGFVSRFPHLEGLTGVPAPHQVEVLPYGTLKLELLPGSAGDPFHRDARLVPNAGVDFKIGLDSDLTLDGALNPDFGQAEVDPAVVNLTDIETYYDEKRPFFIEGANIFRFGTLGGGDSVNINWSNPKLFYSRRIGRAPQGELPEADYSTAPAVTGIVGAVKLSGKVSDAVSLGTLHAMTSRVLGEIETDGVRQQLEVEPYTYYGVARALVERDEGRRGLGGLATVVARHLPDARLADQLARHALAVGADGWDFIDADREWVLTGWAAGSLVAGDRAYLAGLQQDPRHYLQRPDRDRVRYDPSREQLWGTAARLRLEKAGGRARFYSAVGFVDPRFESNDLGYLAETDVINAHLGGGYQWVNPTPAIRDLLVLGAAAANLTVDRDLTYCGVFALVDLRFASFDFIEVLVATNPVATINTRRTRGGPVALDPATGYYAEAYLESDPRRAWTATGSAHADVSPTGSAYYGSTTLGWRPVSSLSLSLGPTVERTDVRSGWVDSFADPTATATFGARYVYADLEQTTLSMDLRVDWTFTPTLSLQLFAQPFLATGRYLHFKELARPRSYDFNVYGRDTGTISRSAGAYEVDPTGSAGAAAFTFADPDFSVKSLRGNAVLRWEYLPGSFLYLIWTQTRARDDGGERTALGRDLGRIVSGEAENILMVKLSYWWSV